MDAPLTAFQTTPYTHSPENYNTQIADTRTARRRFRELWFLKEQAARKFLTGA